MNTKYTIKEPRVVLSEEIDRLRAENCDLRRDLILARQQTEHMLATIRQLYDRVRAEQSGRLEE